MFSPDAKSIQSVPTTCSSPNGLIVLSSSCRLLFIDRKAIALLNVFTSDSPAQKGEQGIPACLMTIAKEVIATSPTIHVHSHGMGVRVRRVLGPPEQPIQVQGFAISSPAQQDMRIILVLSQSNGAIVQGR